MLRFTAALITGPKEAWSCAVKFNYRWGCFRRAEEDKRITETDTVKELIANNIIAG